ncbi:hydroquinone glucosyltransferase-like [Malania oleifera]|uniref:hydroquinone glucosyltransferase-like n=1 Tax=Malania oleifera TaxID=397392 RepID=UPI0025ADEFA9|nr:hydroquinone glucosyltransferase-like [Malania oleifera]
MEYTHPNDPTPHLAMIPTPGMGHIIPLAEFANQLVLRYRFTATLIILSDGSPMTAQKSLLRSLPDAITSHFLSPVNFDDLPPDVKIETRISLSLTRSLSGIRDTVKSLSRATRLVGLVTDLLGTDVFDVAKEFSVLSYIFFPSTAMALSFFFHLPELDATCSCEFRDLPDLIQLPGCIPVHWRDLFDPVQDRKDEAYRWVLHHAKRYARADGIIVNSFLDLESGAFKALKEEARGRPPIYPIGPLTQSGSAIESGFGDGLGCLRWLDEQPHGSVLFVSFGSGGTLSPEQLNELAMGLEMSRQRFIWVVRSPHEKAVNATYFGAQNEEDPSDFLPEGLLARTQKVGLVVPSWAPQVRVLAHGSTGGFLSHCGWNSTLESIVHGVPMVAWPLYAEQRMNAAMLLELGAAAMMEADEQGVVRRGDIAKCVRGIIEGEEGRVLRKKMGELKDAAQLALSRDGSSIKALDEVARMWKNRIIT